MITEATTLPTVEESLLQLDVLLSNGVGHSTKSNPLGDLFAACQSAAKSLGLTGNPTRGSVSQDTPLPDIAYALGMHVRAVTLAGDWWLADHGTLITRDLESGKPVLIRSSRGRHAMEYSSSGYVTGFSSLTRELASKLDTQANALCASFPDSPLHFKDLLSLVLRPYRFELWFYLLLTIVIASLTYLVPVASGLVIDHAVPHRNVTLLFAIVVVVIVCNLLMLSLRYTSELIVQRIEGAAGTDLQTALLERLFRLPMKFLSGYNKADLMRRFTAIEGARRTTFRISVKVGMDSITFLVGLGTLAYYYPVGALAVLVVSALNLGAAWFLGNMSRSAYAEGEALTANVMTIVYELVANMLPIRMFAAQRRAFIRWRDNFVEMRRRQVRSARFGDMYSAFQQSLSLITLCCVFSIVAYSTSTVAPSSIGEYVSFVTSISIVTGSVAGLASSLLAYFSLVNSVSMSLPLRMELPEALSARKKLNDSLGEVELQSVNFKYSDDQTPVFSNLSLHIRPGEYIGVVGQSGCGKSTLVRLLLGLLPPNQGKVFIDRNDLSNVNLDAVRQTFGVVLQDHRMIAGSILENIAAGRELTVEQVLRTLEIIGLASFIKSLPMGIHTVIGESTSLFSGGQIQLIALARALVGEPRMLILDEATSALDSVSVGKVGQVLETLKITRIVFTHRLGTLKKCDRIIVLDRSVVAQEGSYDELANVTGIFDTLLQGKAF